MPIPSEYNERELADYMCSCLAGLGEILCWSVETDYREAVTDTLLAYGVSDISTISGTANLRKLRALAKVIIWERVVAATVGDYDFSADGASFKRSQLHQQAQTMVSQARSELQAIAPELDGYAVQVDTVQHTHDPYQYWPDEVRER